MLLIWGEKERELGERLKRIEVVLAELLKLETLTTRLEKQNGELFDRLMARNWDQWATSPAVEAKLSGVEAPNYAIEPTQDEANIGETLTDEELGRTAWK